jgi:hypothetical protein
MHSVIHHLRHTSTPACFCTEMPTSGRFLSLTCPEPVSVGITFTLHPPLCVRSWNIVVDRVTKLRTGQPGVQTQTWTGSSLLQNVQTGSEADTASYIMGSWGLFLGQGGRSVDLTTHLPPGRYVKNECSYASVVPLLNRIQRFNPIYSLKTLMSHLGTFKWPLSKFHNQNS